MKVHQQYEYKTLIVQMKNKQEQIEECKKTNIVQLKDIRNRIAILEGRKDDVVATELEDMGSVFMNTGTDPLNKLGKEGWLLIQTVISANPDCYTFFFKRELV